MSELYASVLGERGTDLFILHGFLGMGDNWKTLGRKWAEYGFRVHLIDQRNHGRSFWDSEFDYTVMAADLEAYRIANSIDKCVVLGHSMGGKTAMYWACEHPDALLGLVVADIAPKAYPSHHQAILKGLASLDFTQLNNRKAVDAALTPYIPDMAFRQFLLKNIFWVQPGQLGLRVNIDVLKDAGPAVGAPLPSEFICSAPTLFMRGDQSGYIEDQDQLHIQRHFPQAQIEEITQAGHFLHAENPKQFSEVFLAWIEKLL